MNVLSSTFNFDSFKFFWWDCWSFSYCVDKIHVYPIFNELQWKNIWYIFLCCALIIKMKENIFDWNNVYINNCYLFNFIKFVLNTNLDLPPLYDKVIEWNIQLEILEIWLKYTSMIFIEMFISSNFCTYIHWNKIYILQ